MLASCSYTASKSERAVRDTPHNVRSGGVHSMIRSKDGPVQIVSVLVIAIQAGAGWMRIRPYPQFTIVKAA